MDRVLPWDTIATTGTPPPHEESVEPSRLERMAEASRDASRSGQAAVLRDGLDAATGRQDSIHERSAEIDLARGASAEPAVRACLLERAALLTLAPVPMKVGEDVETMDRRTPCRLQRAGPSNRVPAFGSRREDVVDVGRLVAMLLEIEPLGGTGQNGAGRLPAARMDVSDHEWLQPLGEMRPKGGQPVLVAGQNDALDLLLIYDMGQRLGDRLEMLVTMGLDVPGVPRLGELGPAASAVVIRDFTFESHLLVGAGGVKWNQPGALAVDEDDHRGGMLVEHPDELTKIGLFGHDEVLLEGSPNRNHLADAQDLTGEERDAMRLRQLGLLDERPAFLLDPVEVIG